MHASLGGPAAGFVLCGGVSARMGCDKALLTWSGATLVEHAARAVERAAGSVTLIGSPQLYGRFGWPVIADDDPGQGPLGGVVTALRHTRADWNLVTACDMPGLDAILLGQLLASARRLPPGTVALIPRSEAGIEPLCAVYHRDACGPLQTALTAGRRKMSEAAGSLNWAADSSLPIGMFRNINTPADWQTL